VGTVLALARILENLNTNVWSPFFFYTLMKGIDLFNCSIICLNFWLRMLTAMYYLDEFNEYYTCAHAAPPTRDQSAVEPIDAPRLEPATSTVVLIACRGPSPAVGSGATAIAELGRPSLCDQLSLDCSPSLMWKCAPPAARRARAATTPLRHHATAATPLRHHA
jgi:hypothetical protein